MQRPLASPRISPIERLLQNIETVVRGKEDVVRLSLTSLLAGGHLLIEDVPGVGKTTLAQALARSLGGSFQRIQFTSDLLPADILGVSVFDGGASTFHFRPGPVFANVVLADEINRTTPKTQSSLLEAMNEGQVSIDNRTYPLPRPFLVIATQNPVEHHGTYPLPESQMDRFLMRLRMGYPAAEVERRILRERGNEAPVNHLQAVTTPEEVAELQRDVERVKMEESLVDYLMTIVQETRASPFVELGVSTRGALSLYRAAQARALVDGRDYCLPDDVQSLVVPVLAHRILLAAREDTVGRQREEAERVLEEIVERVPLPY
jgi:MoxR-like ATPase